MKKLVITSYSIHYTKLYEGVKDPQAQGLAIGACSHAVGTAAANERGNIQGAFSSLALVLCGILTSCIAPLMFALYRVIIIAH